MSHNANINCVCRKKLTERMRGTEFECNSFIVQNKHSKNYSGDDDDDILWN